LEPFAAERLFAVVAPKSLPQALPAIDNRPPMSL